MGHRNSSAHRHDAGAGAEIDAAVQGALYGAYSEKKPLATQFLLDALAQTVLLSIRFPPEYLSVVVDPSALFVMLIDL